MLCDHVSDALFKHFSFLNYIGRISFPIFAFQLVNGYTNTKNLKKHILKLLIFAIIAQIPFLLFLSTFSSNFYLNIFFTFLLGIAGIYLYSKFNNKLLKFLIIIITPIIGYILKVDYGMFGILLIFTFYIFKDKKITMSIIAMLLCFLKYLPDILMYPSLSAHYLLCGFCTSLSILFITFYNNKEGPKCKYFFYIFYPLHLIILYLINIFLIK